MASKDTQLKPPETPSSMRQPMPSANVLDSAPVSTPESPEQELARLRLENARLRAQKPAPQRTSASLETISPPADIDFLEAIAVGHQGEDGKVITEGKSLFLVSLSGHKSRVVDPVKQTPLRVDRLPIWAGSDSEARDYFENVHHVGLVSSHRLEIEVVAQQAV